MFNCETYDPKRLRETGSLGVTRGAVGWDIITANGVAGPEAVEQTQPGNSSPPPILGTRRSALVGADQTNKPTLNFDLIVIENAGLIGWVGGL